MTFTLFREKVSSFLKLMSWNPIYSNDAGREALLDRLQQIIDGSYDTPVSLYPNESRFPSIAREVYKTEKERNSREETASLDVLKWKDFHRLLNHVWWC